MIFRVNLIEIVTETENRYFRYIWQNQFKIAHFCNSINEIRIQIKIKINFDANLKLNIVDKLEVVFWIFLGAYKGKKCDIYIKYDGLRDPDSRSGKRAAIQQDQAERRGFESHRSRIFPGWKFSRLPRA